MTPPRMPPPPDADTTYLRYALAILAALAAEGGARERAAIRLDIPPRTLNRHIDQLGLGALCAIWPLSGRQPQRRSDPG